MGITLLWAAAPLHTLALESVQLPGSKKAEEAPSPLQMCTPRCAQATETETRPRQRMHRRHMTLSLCLFLKSSLYPFFIKKQMAFYIS